MKDNRFSQSFWIFIKGMIVGTGAILPGISGGVLCVAFGIYEPMMALLSNPIKSFSQYYKMFIPFLIGWLAGFILLAGLVEQLFTTSSTIALMLFAGLIFGTLPQLLQEANIEKKQSWTPFILSIVIFVLLINLMQASGFNQVTPNSITYIFAGAIWGLSLVIPGLSSSSLLIFMGIYQPMTSGIASLDLQVILPLLLGLSITVMTTAKFINHLFETRRALILKVVIGIVIASTLSILPTTYVSLSNLLFSCICFLGGYVLSLQMDIQKNKMLS